MIPLLIVLTLILVTNVIGIAYWVLARRDRKQTWYRTWH